MYRDWRDVAGVFCAFMAANLLWWGLSSLLGG